VFFTGGVFMAHQPSDDSSASPRLHRIRKLIAEAKRKQHKPREAHEPLTGRGPVKPPADLSPPWSSALSRVKKHIQNDRRHRSDNR
jgi:hypothetical protein